MIMAEKMIRAQISPGMWVELPERLGSEEKEKRVTRYLKKINEKPYQFNPNKR